MKQSTLRWYGLLSQLVFALIFWLINLLEYIHYYSFLESLAYSFSYTVLVAGVTIIHYFYVLPLFIKGKKWQYFLVLFGLMTTGIVLFYSYEFLVFGEEEDPSTFLLSIAYDYLLLIITTAYTSLFYFVEQWSLTVTRETSLRNEKLQAELNFLKSQINPHFLFNTLNNIYSYAETGNANTAAMIERLSSILRFMVYDCGQDRVSLTKEVDAVEDLLEILRMKNDGQHNIDLRVTGLKRFHLIAPLIIVNFVENACKHSNVTNHPNGFINVDIFVNAEDICHLQISNTFTPKMNADAKYSGVGSGNTKQRLELQYKDSYQLEEKKEENVYYLDLMIPLERKR
ncbi:MAG: histidine kinase [Bacteroidota bacterium]